MQRTSYLTNLARTTVIRIPSSSSAYFKETSSDSIHQCRRYESSTSSRGRKLETSDKRISAIRDILYGETTIPSHMPTGLPSIDSPASSSTPRQEIDTSQIKPIKDTIERAWAVKKMDEKAAIMEEVRRKYGAMRKAMETLQQMDARLFEGAVANNKIERGTSMYPVNPSDSIVDGVQDGQAVLVFPRRLRVPTETPPINGWK